MTDVVTRVRDLLDDGRGLWLAPGDGTAPDGCAVVATSGSTGAAKLVVLHRDALVAAARAAEARLGWGGTWHLTLPPTYVAGLMVIVRGLVGDGVRAAGLDELGPVGGRNAVSIVGTQLYRALQPTARATADRLASFDAVLVGGGPLAPELRSRAEAAGIPVIETYGMSETCGGVVWDGVPLPGVEVRLGERNRIAIAGPQTFRGYLGAPDLTAEALVDGAVLTRDRGHWGGDRLFIDGRIDDVVISGGVNVDLAEVRRVAASVEPDSDVFAVDDPEWGQRLVLAAPTGSLDGWRDLLRPLLPPASLPRQVVVGPLPRTDGGKPDRAALRALAESQPPSR